MTTAGPAMTSQVSSHDNSMEPHRLPPCGEAYDRKWDAVARIILAILRATNPADMQIDLICMRRLMAPGQRLAAEIAGSGASSITRHRYGM
jgi:hypothetical protein